MKKRFKGTLNDLCKYYLDMFEQEDERRRNTYNPKTIPIVIDEDHSLAIPITIPPSKIRLDNVTIEITFNASDNTKSTPKIKQEVNNEY